MIEIFNEDCIKGAKDRIKNESIDLLICDPPFGIGETNFEKHYNRNASVIDGYEEAPEDYATFSLEWITEAGRVLKKNGTMYIISGWSNLYDVLHALKKNSLITLNHIIWKYNFGVFAKKKFISSHYHILRVAKTEDVIFNSYCRFGPQEKNDAGKSLLNADLEDVFLINKEYNPGEKKNNNKLPNALIQKLIMYSSNDGDLVGDFFLGNFTTAYNAIGLNRNIIGFELNKISFEHHIDKVKSLEKGFLLKKMKKVKIEVPRNQGKKITTEEIKEIQKRYKEIIATEKVKYKTVEKLMKEFGRGKFSITNILKKNIDK